MHPHPIQAPFYELREKLSGDLFENDYWRTLYATDASVYRELPLAVCRPKHKEDMGHLLAFCRQYRLPLIPRAAGTSLAGQVVGRGVIMDCSRYMNRILDFHPVEGWVKLEPGVILDELNAFLAPHGLFFGPETSTSNRCMLGGMVANNACGAHSIVYGSTREHTLEVEALLSDGSEVVFGPLDNHEFRTKCIGNNLENKLYRQIFELLSDPVNQQEINEQYPDPFLKRRNTGYALDLLLKTAVFTQGGERFNFCRMLAGSEGTLAVFTAIKLRLVPLPPKEKALVCVHVNGMQEALQANLIALDHQPVAVELIDQTILECTREQLTQRKNRFFVQGEPAAILVVEFAAESMREIRERAAAMETAMRKAGLGHHYPLITGSDIQKVWALRKAGLGLLSNLPGQAKPVAVIEDAAVSPENLPAFIEELQKLLDKLGVRCVYYAHIGSGELHSRPILDLKNPADVEKFHQLAMETASLVKKYRGSLSGEHGDGRLRSEFIPMVLGDKVGTMLEQVKDCWDAEGILNPGKITRPTSMKKNLRYQPGMPGKAIKSFFQYPDAGGFLAAVERCNGSGDCRKPAGDGGTMCPSYQATLDEDASTRGRANLLREYISRSPHRNPFDHPEILQVLDLCLSCKACKSECPSSVDMARFKSEALYQYHQSHRPGFRSLMGGHYAMLMRMASLTPRFSRALMKMPWTAPLFKALMGFHQRRPLPLPAKTSLRQWASKHLHQLNRQQQGKADRRLLMFCDEFTNYGDAETGIHIIKLLSKLGYRVEMINHGESGRASISKGLLNKAGKHAAHLVRQLAPLINESMPLVGVEPSAILSFRDEYPDMLKGKDRMQARELANHVYTIEEFLCREWDRGRIRTSQFRSDTCKVYFHGHCHQKALSGSDHSLRILSFPPGMSVQELSCGCCGMAGSFGYEKAHYALSMQIGELSLFPSIRAAEKEAWISASGFSCREQIRHGTNRAAVHPAALLYYWLA